MRWKGIPTWGQILLSVVWIVLFVVVALKEASIPFMWVFGIVMTLSLLILCTGSRRWGTVAGIVLYGLLVLWAFYLDSQCFAQSRPGNPGLCGLVGDIVPLLGIVLIPIGTLVGAGIGWIVGKIKEKKV